MPGKREFQGGKTLDPPPGARFSCFRDCLSAQSRYFPPFGLPWKSCRERFVKLPFTYKMLQGWGGAVTFRDGLTLFERGLVLDAAFEDPYMKGSISWGSRSIRTGAKILPDHSCENRCPCRDNVERGIICSHVIALGLA